MIACQYCGVRNRDDARFCNACGGLLPGAKPATPSRAPVPTVPTVPTVPQHATGRLPLQSLLANRYLIFKNIGQGGMAAVYMATDTRTSRTVAIKEMGQDNLSPEELKEALDSFRFEAETLARLRHLNLPRVYEQFSEDARHYLVMDYIDGETLEERMGKTPGKGLGEVEALGWARQLCSALTYLHGQTPPIIFRDLKPSNIMVTRGGEIKLIDFGIARVFAPGRARDTQVLGTPGYAPPEQYGKAQTDARADIYALGCTLYQLLTGYDPAQTPFALPPLHSRNPSIAPHVQLAIERATRLDRDARYQTVAAFERDLLHPAGVYFRTGECARNLNELIALCLRQPAEAAEHLYSGRIEGWLRAWGETAAAASAARAVRQGNDRAAGLRAFVANANAPSTTNGYTGPHTTAGPRTRGGASTATQTAASAATATATLVAVHPNSVALKVLAGQRGTAHFVVSAQAGGSAQGSLMPMAPWLALDRASFNARSTIVQLAADSSRIGGLGLHQSNVRITCGAQHIFLPVTVEVLPAPALSNGRSPRTKPSATQATTQATSAAVTVAPSRSAPATAATTGTSTGTAAGQAQGADPKYAAAAVPWTRLQRMAVAYAMAFGLAMFGLLYVPMGLSRLLTLTHWHVALATDSVPVGTLALLVATALAIPGAWAGSISWRAPGRVRAATTGAVSGLIAAVVATGPLVLTQNGELLVAALVAGGAALGSDALLGRAILTIAAFVARRISFFLSLALMLVGAWAGVLLAGHVAGGPLVAVGLIVGALVGLALGRNISRLLERMTRVSTPRRAYP
jgi:tRNA A-37 threonylcarbamoyl transferase component Bud32